MANSSDDGLPRIRAASAPLNVPVFNIVVYVSHADGVCHARVANLPDISSAASSEPMALKKVITDVKARLQNWCQEEDDIPWIDPVPSPGPDDSQRLIPVHL